MNLNLPKTRERPLGYEVREVGPESGSLAFIFEPNVRFLPRPGVVVGFEGKLCVTDSILFCPYPLTDWSKVR